MKIINNIKHRISGLLVNRKRLSGIDEIDKSFEENGCAVIENFLTKEECDELVKVGEKVIVDYPARVRIESNGSDVRIYQIDEISDKFKNDKLSKIDEWAENFYKKANLKYFQMYGRIKYQEGNLGSGSGWHRDSPFSHQFKFILYLCDVDQKNGPFQYISGTNRDEKILEISKKTGLDLQKYRLSEDEVNNILHQVSGLNVITVTGKIGTLLIADVKGLHRGMPLESGVRMATTRYYFKDQVPSHLYK